MYHYCKCLRVLYTDVMWFAPVNFLIIQIQNMCKLKTHNTTKIAATCVTVHSDQMQDELQRFRLHFVPVLGLM